MKFANKYVGIFLLAVMIIFFSWPIFICQASSGLASVWAEERQPSIVIHMPINTEGLADLGTFVVYILIIVGGLFAISIIMIGGVKMFLASGNEDVHHGAQHAFIAGLISLTIAIVLYFSLDQILLAVKELALNMV